MVWPSYLFMPLARWLFETFSRNFYKGRILFDILNDSFLNPFLGNNIIEIYWQSEFSLFVIHSQNCLNNQLFEYESVTHDANDSNATVAVLSILQ